MAAARIVILNGVGSAGKTSIARALQAIASEPFLHVAMDVFIDMLPETLQDHPDGFAYETIDVDGRPQVVIRTGPVGERLLRGMRHAVAAMAAAGNNLIVDDVMIGDEDAAYRRLLSAFDTVFVGVAAPLEVLEARERQRGDRLIGLARWQYDRVHARKRYDLVVDTSLATAEDCARLIKAQFGL
jgi:chloramphenicol 3-O phosphotransferase